jgi:tetratricopeptide (TPR) repeat protein
LITVDTLRADRLGCYGSDRVATPAIDRLAADGVLFRQAVAQVPLTLPSHCSILTGTYPSAHGVRDQAGFSLGAEAVTLAALLERAGYATGGFVGSSVLSAGTGIARGFGHYSDVPVAASGRGVPRDGLERRGDQVVSEALSWLEAPGRGRAFVWIHLFDPHTPYAPPEPFKSRYVASPYDGEVAFVDSLIGMLIERLERRGWYDTSLIVFTSDHGEALGEHGESTHGFFLYDATVRVPLIIKPVTGGDARRALSGQVRSIDIAPTVLGLAGVDRHPRMQGESLAPRLAGTGADTPLEAYSETYFPYFHFEWSPLTALRTGRYKYVDAPRPELYDLERDPREESNRLGGEPAAAAELERRLRATYPRVLPREGGAPTPAPVDRATAERLRSLGYVGSGAARVGRRLPELSDPKDKIGLYEQLQRALLAAEQGHFEESSAGLRRVLAQDDRILDAHLNLGVNQVQTGAFAGAAESFRRALALDPRNVLASFNLALCHANLGRLDDAILGFRRTLELNPNEVGALVALGRAYQLKGAVDLAIENFRRALERDPRMAEAHLFLAEAYEARGKRAEAAAERERARALGGR